MRSPATPKIAATARLKRRPCGRASVATAAGLEDAPGPVRVERDLARLGPREGRAPGGEHGAEDEPLERSVPPRRLDERRIEPGEPRELVGHPDLERAMIRPTSAAALVVIERGVE